MLIENSTIIFEDCQLWSIGPLASIWRAFTLAALAARLLFVYQTNILSHDFVLAAFSYPLVNHTLHNLIKVSLIWESKTTLVLVILIYCRDRTGINHVLRAFEPLSFLEFSHGSFVSFVVFLLDLLDYLFLGSDHCHMRLQRWELPVACNMAMVRLLNHMLSREWTWDVLNLRRIMSRQALRVRGAW